MSKLNIGFNLDPTPKRVAAIALLMFITAFVTPMTVIFGQGRMPTVPELLASVGLAIVIVSEYLSTFLKTGEPVTA